MKNLSLHVWAALVLFAFIPMQLQAVSNTTPTTKPADPVLVEALNARLAEINEMDKSALSGSEKRALRKEVRTIKSELKTLNGGIYLSVGAIILIVLLLILLL